MRAALLVAVGGADGACARWGTGELFPRAPGDFPWATLLVNLTGCAAIGWAARRIRRPELWLLVVTGGLGGFTTFSTFAVETRELAAGGHAAQAAAYLAVSVGGGLGTARLAAGRTNGKIVFTPDQIAYAVRIGFETGVDVIKVGYTGDFDSFRETVATCPVPVVSGVAWVGSLVARTACGSM